MDRFDTQMALAFHEPFQYENWDDMFAWISRDTIGNQRASYVCAQYLGASSDCCYAQILKGKVDI